MKVRTFATIARSEFTRNRARLGRASLMVVVLLGMLLIGSTAATATTAPEKAAPIGPPAATPTAYYKYPFQDPSLSDEARVADLVGRMTLDEKVALLEQFQGAIIRLGVPQFRTGTEGLHGVSWLGPATVFPQGTGLGMTWDTSLITQVGDVVGSETRAYNSVDARFNGVDIWGPVVDLERDPRAGRTSENMGEDPYLTGLMATYYSSGIRGSDPFYYQAIPTLKHFTAYNMEANRAGYSANASPRNLYEYFFKSFEPAIAAGMANGIMTGYNLVAGKPTMVQPEMMSVLYDQWVPGGYANGAFFNVTDAGSPGNLTGSNAFYPSNAVGIAAAFADSIKDGTSVMTPGDTDTPSVRRPVYEAIARGLLTEADLDRGIHGILLVRLHAGDLDADPINPYKDLNKENALNTPAQSAVAAQAAREQVVLLKNDGGILPLSKSLPNVVLAGPLADENSTDFYAGTYPYATYIKDSVESKLTGGAGALSFTRGLNIIALQVISGTGTPNGKFIVVGGTPGSSLTGTGTSASDPRAQFYHYDYGYDNMLLRSVMFDQEGPGCNCYVARRGSGSTLAANAFPPGFISNNRASQQWTTDQNFGFVQQVGNVVGLNFPNSTGIPNPTGNPNVYVNTNSPYNVQYNGNGSSPNRQFSVVTVTDGIADAVTKATGADVAIVAVGDQPSLTSRETQDRLDNAYNIKLPPYQESLIDAVAAVNPNTVVVIVGSYAFDIRDIQANPNVKAIVYTSHAGQDLGTAVADVLFGDYAPAGKLNQTWYPGYQVLPNITDFDVIEGQRTYQYYTGTVLYPFGYGLSYSTFDDSSLTVNPPTAVNTDNTNFAVSLTVQNTGAVASDEVVELYTKYADTATSTVAHPLKTLSGFQRIHLAPGASTVVNFTVKMADLAIWDVTRNMFFVEPGTYTFMVGRSSADADMVASTNVSITGSPIPPRNLGSPTLAYNWDAYSFTNATADGLTADVVPASAMEDNSYSIQVKKAGAWVKYANVNIMPAPAGISLRASNANATAQNVDVWMNGPSVTAGGTLLGSVGIPATGHIQTYVNVGATLSGFSGTHADIYLVFSATNLSVTWLQLGTITPATSPDILVTSNNYNSSASTSLTRLHVKVPAVITQKSGNLLMEAVITDTGVVTSRVTWSVTDNNGNATTLATINTSGQLTATGTGDGLVRAVASYDTTGGTISAYQTVQLQNQTVTANTNPDAIVLRSGWDSRPADISWGPNQFTNFGAIYQYKGTLVVSAVTYPGVNPARPVTFSLTDEHGNPSTLATVVSTAAGFVQGQTSGSTNAAYNATIQATGVGDGDVYVTGTTSNGLSYTTKIVIQGQTTHDPFVGRTEAELFDASGNVLSQPVNLRADDVHGDDVGLQLNRIRNGDYAAYDNMDFGTATGVDMTLKYVKVSTEPATITVMADDPMTGTVLGHVTLAGTYDITSPTDYANVVYHWQQTTIRLSSLPGVHNIYFVFTISPNVPNTDISSTYGAVAGWLDLGLNWFEMVPFTGAYAHLQPSSPITVSVGTSVTLDLLVNSGTHDALSQQSYLTFPPTLLQNVLPGTAGTPSDSLSADLTSFPAVLQNQVCNGPGPCTFGNLTAPAGSIAYASGVLTGTAVGGDFRVAQVTFLATALGDATVHWQFSPPDPANRNSRINDANNQQISEPALYQDYIIHVVSPNVTGHVIWEGRPTQPDPLQALPITLTLTLGNAVYAFNGLTTDANGNFSVSPAALPPGVYTWRVKGPTYLSTSGTITIGNDPNIFDRDGPATGG